MLRMAGGERMRHALQAMYRAPFAGYGQDDADWLWLYRFVRERLGIGELPRLDGLRDLARFGGLYFPFREVCVMVERPVRRFCDDAGRFHCEYGAALAFPDGEAIFAMEGVRLPAHVVLAPQSITAEEIRACRNQEQARLMIERFGTERYLDAIGAKIVHRDDWGTLFRSELADREPVVFVKVANATPDEAGRSRNYFLRVPPEMRSAHEAVAWTFRKTPETYRPTLQT